VKRIVLDVQHSKQPMPSTAIVKFETDTYIVVVPKWSMGREITLTKQPDGTLINENHVVYVRSAVDRRPKPFTVTYRGIDGKAVTKFATLADVQTYVKGRWQGVDYIDSSDGFHNDYGGFTLSGCKLSDLGKRVFADDGVAEWEWSAIDGGAQ
jgi:hypothetical protein